MRSSQLSAAVVLSVSLGTTAVAQTNLSQRKLLPVELGVGVDATSVARRVVP